jgi:hypothetical protein
MSDTKERLTRKAGVVAKELPDRGAVFIRAMSTDEVLAIGEMKDRKTAMRQMISDGVVEADGSKIFTPEEAGALDWVVAKALSDLVIEVNALKLSDERMKDAEKNSTAPRSSP